MCVAQRRCAARSGSPRLAVILVGRLAKHWQASGGHIGVKVSVTLVENWSPVEEVTSKFPWCFLMLGWKQCGGLRRRNVSCLRKSHSSGHVSVSGTACVCVCVCCYDGGLQVSASNTAFSLKTRLCCRYFYSFLIVTVSFSALSSWWLLHCVCCIPCHGQVRFPSDINTHLHSHKDDLRVKDPQKNKTAAAVSFYSTL